MRNKIIGLGLGILALSIFFICLPDQTGDNSQQGSQTGVSSGSLIPGSGGSSPAVVSGLDSPSINRNPIDHSTEISLVKSDFELSILDEAGDSILGARIISIPLQIHVTANPRGTIWVSKEIFRNGLPALVYADGFSPHLLESFPPAIHLAPAMHFKGRFVDLETREGLSGIAVRPFLANRKTRDNIFRALGLLTAGFEPVKRFETTSDANGFFELYFSKITGQPLALEVEGFDGFKEIIFPQESNGCSFLEGTWEIPIQARASLASRLLFVTSDTNDVLAGKPVQVWRGGLRDYLSTDLDGAIPIFYPFLGARQVDGRPITCSLIEVEEEKFWLEAWPPGKPARFFNDVTVLVDCRPILVQVDSLSEDYEVGVVALGAGGFIKWPRTNQEIIWTKVIPGSTTSVSKGFFAHSNSVILRHAASKVIVDRAEAACGSEIRLMSSATGQLSVMAVIENDPIELDWEVFPSSIGRLAGVAGDRLERIRFSSARRELSLPIGEYWVFAYLEGAALLKKKVTVSPDPAAVSLILGKDAGIQRVRIRGSLSGAKTFVQVDSLKLGGELIDRAFTDQQGFAEIFLSGTEGEIIRAQWTSRIEGAPIEEWPVHSIFWTIDSNTDFSSLEVKEAPVTIEILGAKHGAGLILEHTASQGDGGTVVAEIPISDRVDLIMPWGRGKVRVLHSGCSELESNFDNSLGGLARCELDFSKFVSWTLVVNIEGGGSFDGNFATSASVNGIIQPISSLRHHVFGSDGKETLDLIGMYTEATSLSVEGTVFVSGKKYPLNFDSSLLFTGVGETRLLNVRLQGDMAVAGIGE